MDKQRVCIYSRVSTSDGKQDTKRQIDELLPIIYKDGFTDAEIDIYSETVSGYKNYETESKLDEILKKVRDFPKYYTTIYIHELSRLGRKPRTTLNIIEELSDIGVNVFIKQHNLNTLLNGERDPFSHLLIKLFVEFYDLEVKTFKTRSKSGLLKSARDGKMGGGIFHTYGYKKDANKMMIIDEEESIVIKKIFQLYLDGNGIKVISNILNEENIPTRTNKSFPQKTLNFNIKKKGIDVKWSDGQIHKILTNSTYIGKRKFSNTIVSCPPIIDEVTFNMCGEILKSKNTKGSTIYNFLLKDILKCGKCNRNYYGRFKPEKNGDKVYKCSSTRLKNQSCGNLGVNIKLIESTIYHFTSNLFNIIEIYKYSDPNKELLTKERNVLVNTIKSNEIEVSKLKKKVDRLLDVFEEELIDKKTFIDRRDKYHKQIKTKELKIDLTKREVNSMNEELNMTFSDLKLDVSDRNKLRSTFSNIYSSIIVTKTTDDFVFITTEIPLNNKDKITSNLCLNRQKVRKKNPEYTYKVESINVLFNDDDYDILKLQEKTDDLELLWESELEIEEMYLDKEIEDKEQNEILIKNKIDNNILMRQHIARLLRLQNVYFKIWFEIDEKFQIDMVAE